MVAPFPITLAVESHMNSMSNGAMAATFVVVSYNVKRPRLDQTVKAIPSGVRAAYMPGGVANLSAGFTAKSR